MAGSIVGIDIGNGSCKIAVREQGIRLVSSRMPENVMTTPATPRTIQTKSLPSVH